MRYVISGMADEVGAAGGNRAAIDAFNDRLRAEGLWVDAVLKIIPEASKACNAKIEIRPFKGE